MILAYLLLQVADAKSVDALPPFYVTAPNSIVQSYGPMPPGSGYIQTWRRISILENGIAPRTLVLTWLGENQAIPPFGASCSLTYHKAYITGYADPPLEPLQEHLVLDDFECAEALPGR